MPTNLKALVLTVGTGTKGQEEETLLQPILNSVKTGAPWEQIYLLASQDSRKWAKILEERLIEQGYKVQRETLPDKTTQDDVDACFIVFDRALEALLKNYQPSEVVFDYTRGTKAMSAAAVLAATRHEIGTLRYVTSPQSRKDIHGRAKIAHTIFHDGDTSLATAARALDKAKQFMFAGNYAAVLELLAPDTVKSWSRSHKAVARALSYYANFYLAWDSLDYAGAAKVASQLERYNPAPGQPWERLAPNPAQFQWVRDLKDAKSATSNTPKKRLPILWQVAADLLANAERRMKDGLLELAFLLTYRATEIALHAALCESGIEPANSNLEKALDLIKDQKLVNAIYPLVREKQAPLHRDNRNKSLLIHGYKAMPAFEKSRLRETHADLVDALCSFEPANFDNLLEIAYSCELAAK